MNENNWQRTIGQQGTGGEHSSSTVDSPLHIAAYNTITNIKENIVSGKWILGEQNINIIKF